MPPAVPLNNGDSTGPNPGQRDDNPLRRCRDHNAVITRTLRKCPGDDCTDNKIYHAHNPARRDDHLETASATKRCTCSAADRNTVTKRRRSMSRPEAPEALPGEAARRSCAEKRPETRPEKPPEKRPGEAAREAARRSCAEKRRPQAPVSSSRRRTHEIAR